MVRLVPPRLVPLLTFALQGRFRQDGVAPVLPTPPASPAALPTGYRDSQREAVGDPEGGGRPQWRRLLSRVTGLGRGDDDQAFLAFFAHEMGPQAIRTFRERIQVVYAVGVKWAKMTEEERAPFGANSGPQAHEVAEESADEEADFAAYLFFAHEKVDRAGTNSPMRTLALSSEKWGKMDAEAKAPYVDKAAQEDAQQGGQGVTTVVAWLENQVLAAKRRTLQ